MNANPTGRLETPLERAFSALGGLTKLADRLGKTRQAVYQWKAAGVPAEMCPEIEEATKGAVRCEELRPDVKWHVLRRKQRPARASS